MDYSAIDEAIKEELAERVAKAVHVIENLANVYGANLPDPAFKSLLDLRHELIRLVKDLGGHPAVP